MAEYRTGRRNGHTIYFQAGDEPADSDEFIGSCVQPGFAQILVQWANLGMEAASQRQGTDT